MQNLLKGLPESVQQTISASLPLAIVIILFLFVGKFGLPRVLGIRTEIKSAESSETIMTQKLKLLQTFSSTANLGTSTASTAVPSENASLEVVSQVKTISSQSGAQVSSVKTSSVQDSSSDLSKSTVSFTLEGSRQQIFDFVDSITKIAPIIVVDKIDMSEAQGSVRADITVDSYWADLPKTIPSIDTPISDLTQTEKDTLSKLNSLVQPTFSTSTPGQVTGTNPNPFGE